ncbi:MAG: proton-conducting transporter membrane subunit [bacterium]|nr:proton-conducting transporter membrane subunit [bacterium]MDD5755954.1 proton-conducting transporter membrane subunit [bacterium]
MSDPLSLFFLATILIVTIPSFVYSIGYLKKEYSPKKILLGQILTFLFVLSMLAVVTVSNMLAFLIAWEIMSLVSYFLVVFDSEHEKSIQAGTIYVVMTHAGTAFLVAAFLLLYQHTHSFDFNLVKVASQTIPVHTRNIIFIFLLIGFGTKAGIVPLHIWLPYAHPQAPSHISSMMSGVMIKTAIYGLIRFIIYLLGVNDTWWGTLVLILAIISCLVGIIYALMEKDIKKLLAYSSVENIGIILFGVGLSMYFMSKNMSYWAVFALIAGLYHLINHAIFKGLLFLCAGSVYKAAGTRNMEKLGGLIRTMPITAACFLIGAMGISALPPLNGFVSEWLTLQAFFMGAWHTPGTDKLFLGFCAAMLALTSGLAAACFVKAFGITFLAKPRSSYAEKAIESPVSMRFGMLFLAGLTIIFGLGAAVIINILSRVAGASLGIDTSAMVFSVNNITIHPLAGNAMSLSPLTMALILVLCGLLGWIIYKVYRKRAISYNTWDCGYYRLDARHEYTATGFSKPLRIAFSFFLRPYRTTKKSGESFYHIKSMTYETHTTPVFKKYIYKPVLAITFKSAKFMRRIQPGSIHVYLAYIAITIFVLIILIRKF